MSLVTPTEAVLFRPATQGVNGLKITGLCEVKSAKIRFDEYVSSLEVYRLKAKETNRQNREES